MVRRSEDEFVGCFKEASDSWDLERLYKDLADAKQKYATSERRRYKDLTAIEMVYLRGLLCGNHPDIIAQVIDRDPGGVRVALSNGLYTYVEILIGKRPKDWRDVSDFLEQAGYQIKLPVVALTNPIQTENSSTSSASPHYDWGEAPDVSGFVGRKKELNTVGSWIVNDRCRLVAILGMGGIGKTDLSVKLVQQVQDDFEYVIWRSLREAPSAEKILSDLLKFLSNQQQIDLPERLDHKISLLIACLREHRCLIVLDNAESILQAGNRAGYCRKGYTMYGDLFKRIGESSHISCLILTSREKLKEFTRLEGDSLSTRSLELESLGQEAQEILKVRGITATQDEFNQLINIYHGNPLALQIVPSTIKKIFNGSISNFLKTNTIVFGEITDLLEEQFNRLSNLEKEVMYWLTINRELVLLDELKEDFILSVSRRHLIEALDYLGSRSMIQKIPQEGQAGFTLQNVVMEFMTNRLVEHVCKEIQKFNKNIKVESFKLLKSHALMKAQTKDYIRNTQVNLIVEPVITKLLDTFGSIEILKKKLAQTLSVLREKPSLESGYVAGNILNILCSLQTDLCNYDFSYLKVWQAYLQNINLYNFSFAYSKLAKCVFTQTFGSILSVVYSPDGQFVAAGDANGEIRLWKVADSQLHLTRRSHNDWIRSIAFSPDGQKLVSGSDDQNIRLWDIKTGQCLKTFRGHSDWIRFVAFSPDGQTIASCSNDKTIRLWNIDTGECLRIFQEHTGWVWSIAFSPDGQKLVSGSDDQTVKLWDVRTGKCLNTLLGHTNSVQSVAFSPDGQILGSGSDDKTVKLWDVRTGKCLNTLLGHTNSVQSVAFSPDGQKLGSGGDDRTIKLWEVRTGKYINTLRGHTNSLQSVAFSPDGRVIASGGYCQTIRLWDIYTEQCLKTLQGHTNWMHSIAFNPDGQTLVSGSEDHTVRLWDVRTGQFFRTLRGHDSWVWSVAFSPNRQIVASCSNDRTVRLWDVETGECLNILQGHDDWICSLAFSPNGQTLASCSNDRTVKLWDVETGECLRNFLEHTDWVWSVAFSPNGQTIASGGKDQFIRLWDVHAGKNPGSFYTSVDHLIQAIAFSPDGQIVASGSSDYTVRLWDISTGQCLMTLHDHANSVQSIAFSPDGQTIASGGSDRVVKIWDISTGQCLKALQEHTSRVRSVTFSPDGLVLASSSADGTIKLWNIQTGECLKTMISPRPYEGMNIIGVDGLTDAQKTTLKSLGAVEVASDFSQDVERGD
jgi:WD40 repeat protein